MESQVFVISGFTFSEPVTSLTDIVLAVICLILAIRVRKRCNESLFNNAWRLFFLFTGISTLIGSFAHGLQQDIPEKLFNTLWLGMNICSSVSVFFALRATIRFTNAPRTLRIYLVLSNYILLITFVLLTLLRNDFEIFKVHASIALFIIFLTHGIAYFKNHVGSGSVALGIIFSFITVCIHTAQLSISTWFNYKDISHVIMMVSLIMIYNGLYLMSRNLDLSFRRNQLRLQAIGNPA